MTYRAVISILRRGAKSSLERLAALDTSNDEGTKLGDHAGDVGGKVCGVHVALRCWFQNLISHTHNGQGYCYLVDRYARLR